MSAASGLDAAGYKEMKPSSFHNKMCTFNHAPKNSNDCAQTQGSTSEVTSAISPLCTRILGWFAPQSILPQTCVLWRKS